MRRMERRMYKRRRGQAIARRILLGICIAALAIAAWKTHGRVSLRAQTIADPTATPLTANFDQTIQEREITLEQESWYAIQTGIFSSVEAAQKKAEAYADRGAPGYVAQDGAKWRVFIACYGAKEDASAVRTRLSEVQAVETYLHEWVCPQLRLRLRGMAGQLDVLEAGLKLRQQAAVLLRDHAALLDSGEKTLSEIQELAAAMDEQVSLWSEVVMDRFARPYPDIIGRLLSWAEEWESASAGIKKAAKTGATELSAELKAQGMKLYESNIRFREELNAQ